MIDSPARPDDVPVVPPVPGKTDPVPPEMPVPGSPNPEDAPPPPLYPQEPPHPASSAQARSSSLMPALP